MTRVVDMANPERVEDGNAFRGFRHGAGDSVVPLTAGEGVSCICVAQATTLGVEDTIEAGDEHVGWYVGKEGLVDSLEHIAGRRGALGCKSQHAAGCGHNQGCGYTFACCVPHHKPHSTLREEVEVIEVSSYFPSGLVVGSDLPLL